MLLAVVHTRANIGIEAPLVSVEAHISNGMPGFSIVGLPETAVKESKDRVKSAILNSQLEFPSDRHITINLAPADLPKSGGRYDLAIAVGILAASGQLPGDRLTNLEFLGELALSGEVRAVVGILPGILAAIRCSSEVIIPRANESEAGLVKRGDIRVCSHLLEVLSHIRGTRRLEPVPPRPPQIPVFGEDMIDIVGQFQARRALTVAAAGGHNLLMQGPPGTGKTMLASRMPTILPLLDESRALEVAAVRSIASSGLQAENWLLPPFRAPHHTASAVALVGGGSSLKVGEISLAHHGVLFLDELPEFSPKVLEVMRQPLESGAVCISRASYQVRLPAQFQLIAAMNPCPCGYYGDPDHDCRCSEEKVRNYQLRVSGPLLDRIDIHIHVHRLQVHEKQQLLASGSQSRETSRTIRARVAEARKTQILRSGKINARLSQAEIKRYCTLAEADEALLKQAMEQLRLSARAFFRILKMARTIADLEGAENIGKDHLLEAISYRCPGHRQD